MFKKLSRMLPLVAALVLVVSLTPIHAQDAKTLKIWYYEKEDSAMGISWADAQADFQAADNALSRIGL